MMLQLTCLHEKPLFVLATGPNEPYQYDIIGRKI